MSYSNTQAALQQYTQTGTHSAIAVATPHRLIQMLMDGAISKIAVARGCMERGEIANTGSSITLAISIIDGLRMSLDKDSGGEIAENLDSLYDYMSRRLVTANIEKNPAILDEVSELLREIKSAWDAIPTEFHHSAQAY